MSRRKHISWKTKCASVLLALKPEMYDDAKQMTEDQLLSLWTWDHNILHSSEHEDRDKYWNLTPMFIAAHRTKTKADAKIVAKSKRIRANSAVSPLRIGLDGQCQKAEDVLAAAIRPARTLQSRGFDKRLSKGFDGKVRPRK